MTPEQATVVCAECGRRVKARERDGSPVMHHKILKEPWKNPWCHGGYPKEAW